MTLLVLVPKTPPIIHSFVRIIYSQNLVLPFFRFAIYHYFADDSQYKTETLFREDDFWIMALEDFIKWQGDSSILV